LVAATAKVVQFSSKKYTAHSQLARQMGLGGCPLMSVLET
jgi:hypothetical protein